MSIAVVAAGCGSIETPVRPTPIVVPPLPPPPPAVSIDDLRGQWTGSGSTLYTNAQGLHDGYSCTRAVSITRQQGDQLSGSVRFDGVGPESDKHCLYSSAFTGTIAADGTFTLRMDKPFTSSFYCKRLSGEDVYTGRLTADSQLEAQMTDRVSCVSIGGTYTYEAERTIRFKVGRVCAPPDARCPVE